MEVLVLMLVLSGIAYLAQYALGDRRDVRMALRHGMAGGFIFTGLDHFLTLERYVPLMPAFLAPYAVELVYLSGIAELAGAVGLLVPLALYRRLGLPDLRRWAGIGLAVMLAVVVIANINVAVNGLEVQGLPFGRWYYWFRLLLQPIFIVWALYAGGVIGRQRRTAVGARPSVGTDVPLAR